MNKLIENLKTVNPLSIHILKCVIVIWGELVLSYLFIKSSYLLSPSINLLRLCCIENYPLIILMCLTLGITGAILIDIYEKTRN